MMDWGTLANVAAVGASALAILRELRNLGERIAHLEGAYAERASRDAVQLAAEK